MGSISRAEGTITLTGNWTIEIIEKLNIVKEAWFMEEPIGVCVSDFSADALTQSFIGGGDQWLMNTLDCKQEIIMSFVKEFSPDSDDTKAWINLKEEIAKWS